MRYKALGLTTGVVFLLSTVGGTIAHAQGDGSSGSEVTTAQEELGQSGGADRESGTVGPRVSATPELDSIALFGTGAAGLAGYALMRLRAARRKETNSAD